MPPEATSRPQAEFYLDVAEKLLAARDLVGSRRFALQALDADPILDGVDQVLAVADVLLASEKRVNNHLDWYAVLNLDSSPSSAAVSLDTIKREYRRLALLLNPDKNLAAGSESAYKLVLDAWSVLSDPSKRALYDKERDMALRLYAAAAEHSSPAKPKAKTAAAPGSVGQTTERPGSFWTGCPYCYNVYEYSRVYESRNVLCQSCKRGFRAFELKEMPEIVPGMDAYYYNYGFCPPVGFKSGSGPNPNLATTPGSNVNPFAANFPQPEAAPSARPQAGGGANDGEKLEKYHIRRKVKSKKTQNVVRDVNDGGSPDGSKGQSKSPGVKQKTTAVQLGVRHSPRLDKLKNGPLSSELASGPEAQKTVRRGLKLVAEEVRGGEFPAEQGHGGHETGENGGIEIKADGLQGDMMDTDISDVLSSFPKIFDEKGDEVVIDLNDIL